LVDLPIDDDCLETKVLFGDEFYLAVYKTPPFTSKKSITPSRFIQSTITIAG
jgi:hypothetical protein